MEPLVTTVSKAARVIEARRVVIDVFMSLSSWDHQMWPVEENVDDAECNCIADATNCRAVRYVGQIL
jgi:hypothetical protein